MHATISKLLSRALVYVELFIAVVLLIAVLLGMVGLIASMGVFHGDPFDYSHFSEFLANAFTLVIGIEFVRMLVKHTAGSVVEVLLFAIARQLVLNHNGTLDTLLGIVAIAGVFAVRKYLFVGTFNPSDLFIFNTAKPVTQVNRIAHTRLPDSDGLTIGALMEQKLAAQSRPLEEGAKVTFGSTVIRIATLDEGKIETLDVFSHLDD